MKKLYKKGQKYILRSNENEPLQIGEFIKFAEFGENIPIMKINKKEKIVFSLTTEYTEKLWKTLITLSPKKQMAYIKNL